MREGTRSEASPERRRRAAAGVATTVAALAALGGPLVPAAAPAAGESVRPVTGEVVAPFDPPSSPYGPGRRGVRLDADVGEAVRAVRAGRVAFAGPVAGTPWVSVDHGGGLRTSYGPVAPLVAAGDRVAAGTVVGRVAEGGADDPGGLHWGARVDGVYVDPLDLLRAWRPTLLPVDAP